VKKARFCQRQQHNAVAIPAKNAAASTLPAQR
jgi:PhoPQ-activated pathogenicity-related protein